MFSYILELFSNFVDEYGGFGDDTQTPIIE